MIFTPNAADTAEFLVLFAFNFVAGTFTFTLARYLRPRQDIAWRRSAAVFLIGWTVGSVIVYTIHQLVAWAAVDMPDAAKILVSLAVLYLLMDKLFEWLTSERHIHVSLGRHKTG